MNIPKPKGVVIDKAAAKRIATSIGWEPKREWVGLTDEQKQWIKETEWTTDELIEWINTKLKEKNT